MKRVIILTISFIFLCFPTFILKAQKVALVLSGGGAKGVVHVGVLKALEENDIPIDYITGTSMGAIVGGLYASGYSPEEIESLVTSDKFMRLTSGVIDNKYRYYFKQESRNASWINIKFYYDISQNKIRSKLPTNVISPFEMDFEFMQLFASASAVADYNFDSLLIPFRCVASDIEANEAVIMDRGQLGNAIRASMTFPFYFMPINIDGKLLFDGGMYNNFPSDIAVDAFNPDVIIGSKAAGNYGSPSQDDIISQIQNMLMAKTDYDVILNNGVLIEHDLGKVNILDFSRTKEFIDSGYVRTMDNIDEIKSMIHERINREERQKQREEFNIRKPQLVIDTINVKGLNKSQSRYVYKILKKRALLITLKDIKKEYFQLLADDKISYIFPELKYNKESGYYDLFLDVKPSENFIVEFGGNISTTSANEAFFGINYRYLSSFAVTVAGNAYIGRFYSSLQARTKFDFPSRPMLYTELGYTYNHRNYFKNTTYFIEDVTPSFLVENESFIWFDIGIPVTNTGKLVGGVSLVRDKDEYYQTNSFSRLDTTDVTYFDFYTPRILFELNSLNYKQYANRGIRLIMLANYVNGIEKNIPGSTSINREEFCKHYNWFQFKLIYDNYFERIGPFKLGFYCELLISDQPLFNNYISTIMASPAFEPLPESKVLFLPKYRAHNYAAAGLKIIGHILKKLDFRLEGYLFQPYQEIIQKPDLSVGYGEKFSNRSYMGTAALVWYSPIGPLSISVNHYDRAYDQFSIFANFGYIIFNRSAIN
ncbi:MAG: patatin-like phospholipase family protein [Bacteroidetes bacterium]|nr:patatin-like phospholipase family protein [Bacteroidota bacterium]